MDEIILASESPRRKEMFDKLGIKYRVCASNVNEKITPEMTPAEAALFLAVKKAKEVFDRNKASIVVGCDTVVGINGLALMKPRDEREAFQMLKLLSGKTHTVYTGVAIIGRGINRGFCEATQVSIIKLSDETIRRYIKTENVLDKAGAYAIQGKMGLYIERIDGDYNNVVGMPVAAVIKELSKIGYNL